MTVTGQRQTLMLRPEPQAVGVARHLARRTCTDAGLERDVCETAVLLTSETVTNAIIHGRSEVRLAITAGPNGVRVEVGDDNSRRPVLQADDQQALDGRGLSILASEASSWGVADDRYGKIVWFELHLSANGHN